MTNPPDIRQFPPARDCVRAWAALGNLARPNEQRFQKNGAMLIYAATEGARDAQNIDDAISVLAELPEASDDTGLELECADAAYQCGWAIGQGQCSRWQYDLVQHEIVARG